MKINNFRAQLTDFSAMKGTLVIRYPINVSMVLKLKSLPVSSEVFFLFFWGYFDPAHDFFDNKNN